MADKNLHDIKIDELDNSKKTPLKNILTLLALLFIILVISVAITRLILNTDEDGLSETNSSTNSAMIETEDGKDNGIATTAGVATAGLAGAMLANRTRLTERNVSTTTSSDSSKDNKKDETSTKKDSGSKTKVALREHQPTKEKVVTHHEPKNHEPKKHTVVHHKVPVKHVTKKEPVHNEVDRVVSSSKHTTTTHSSNKTSSTQHKVSHLGEKRAGYYIKVGTFKDTQTAVNKIKKTGLDYILIKPKNDKTTTRVLIGPFKSNWGAKQHLPNVKEKIAEGAYITRID